jgi:hypothetical protein
MSIEASSMLRSVALLSAATTALAMLAQIAMAKDPGPPGLSPYFYSRSVGHGFAPRPDFPGAKQSNMVKILRSAKHHKTSSQQ